MQTIGLVASVPTSRSATTRRQSQPFSAVSMQKFVHPMPPEKVEIFKSLESWASKDLLPILKPVEKSWQPNEFLPEPTKPDFMDEVRALRDRTKELPDEYFVVLVGNMITEEALPTYQASMINFLDPVLDKTGSSPNSWDTWIRAWTAEENKHGDLLKTYLYLSGRVDMLMIEKTLQYLIGTGMDLELDNNPYLGFVYTSFQERATFVSHCNTAQLANKGGDPVLSSICGTIAADEKRHENAYVKVVEKLLEIDPNEAMIAIGKLIRKKITMPAHLMTDGYDSHLFEHFAFVSHKIGVYKPDDYVDILEFLVGRWRLEKLEGLNGDARCEQDFVCNLGHRMKKLIVKADERAKNYKGMKFSWIFNREINI